MVGEEKKGEKGRKREGGGGGNLSGAKRKTRVEKGKKEVGGKS